MGSGEKHKAFFRSFFLTPFDPFNVLWTYKLPLFFELKNQGGMRFYAIFVQLKKRVYHEIYFQCRSSG